MLRKRAASISSQEEGKWKQMLEDQNQIAQQRFQMENERLAFKSATLQKDLEAANQELRTISSSYQAFKDDTLTFRTQVASEREARAHQENQAIAALAALQKEVRDLNSSVEKGRREKELLEDELKVLKGLVSKQEKVCQEKSEEVRAIQ